MIPIRELMASPPPEMLAVAPYERAPGRGLDPLPDVRAAVARQLAAHGRAAALFDAAIAIGSQADRVVRALRDAAPGIREVLLLDADPRMLRTLVASGGAGEGVFDDAYIAALPATSDPLSVPACLEILGFLTGRGHALERTFLYVHPQTGADVATYAPLEAAARDLFHGLGAHLLASITTMGASGRAQLASWGDHFAATGAPLHALKLYAAARDDETAPRLAAKAIRCWKQVGCMDPIADWLSCLGKDAGGDHHRRDELAAALAGARADGDACLGANLAALAAHHPAVHRKVATCPAAPSLVEASLPDAAWVVQPIDAPELDRRRYPVIIELASDGFELATALPSLPESNDLLDLVWQKHAMRGLLFGSVRRLDVMLNALAFPPQLRIPSWEHAVYVVERNLGLFRQVLRSLHLVAFFEQPRISWFVGEDAGEDLRAFFVAHRERQLCDLHVDVDTPLDAMLKSLAGERRLVHDRSLTAMTEAYAPTAERPAAIRAALTRRERRPRIGFMSSYFTTVVKYCVADLARAAAKLGLETLELVEKSGTDNLAPAVCIERLLDFRPDLLVMVDRLRPSFGYLPTTLPTVAWIQDELPRLADRASIDQLGQLDLAYSVSTPLVEGYRALGYPWVGLMHMGANVDVYRPDPGLPQPTDEVAFITNLAPLVEPAGCPGLNAWMLRALEERGIGRTNVAYFEPLVREAAADLGITIPEDRFRSVVDKVRIDVELHFDRAHTARTLLRAGIPLALYGGGWDDLPEFRPYARGRVAQGAELCRVYQRHKVVLHVNALLNMHQRVLEGLAAGGFVLARSSPTDGLPGELASCLEIGTEVAVYSTPEELVETIRRAFADEAWRRGVAEAGRRRVCAHHTYEERVQRLVADVAAVVLAR